MINPDKRLKRMQARYPSAQPCQLTEEERAISKRQLRAQLAIFPLALFAAVLARHFFTHTQGVTFSAFVITAAVLTAIFYALESPAPRYSIWLGKDQYAELTDRADINKSARYNTLLNTAAFGSLAGVSVITGSWLGVAAWLVSGVLMTWVARRRILRVVSPPSE